MNDIKIFSGTSNIDLADKICKRLNIELGEIYHHTFPSGESYIQFKENIRGKDVFLIQSPGSGNTNDYLMQLLIMGDSARRASAGRITAVLPMAFYSRQDRKDKSRTPISAKLVMDLFKASGFNRVVTMDLHSPQVGGFTNLPFDHLSFKPSLIDALKENKVDIDVVVSPDIGAVKRTTEYADSLKKDLAIIAKKRLSDTSVSVKQFIGDVKDKNVLIIDDLTESVGTLVEASKACKEQGAKEINVAVTHGCFSGVGILKLKEALKSNLFNRFFHSNTISLDWYRIGVATPEEDVFNSKNIISVDVSPVFAIAIERIHNNESVSELF